MANNEQDSLFLETVKQVPDATRELIEDAWAHPVDTAKHAALALGTGIVAGKLFSMFIPARGPAALATGVLFTLPLAAKEYERWSKASELANDPGANVHDIAKDLARGTLTSGADLALGFAGGAIGSRLGHEVATSDTMFGRMSQRSQRALLKVENKILVGAKGLPETVANRSVQTALSLRSPLMETRMTQLTEPAPLERIKMVGSGHAHSNLSDGTGSTLKNLQDARDAGLDFYAITDHNHLAARDGIKPGDPRANDQAGIPILASNPKAYAEQFADAAKVTKDGEFVGIIGVEMGTIGKVGAGKGSHGAAGGHDHGSLQFARDIGGNTTTQFRVVQPDGSVTVHTHRLDADHAAAVERAGLLETPGAAAHDLQHSKLTPAEQALADADARTKGHHGGVNHINLYDVPTFFEAVRQPRQQTFADLIANPFRRALGLKPAEVVKAPDVVRYNDGDYKAMVAHLDKLTDTTGKPPVIQLNHPRFQADWDTNLPASVRGRDYGVKSFDNIQQWRDQFGKYASQIEIITGQAMNPNPVEAMRTTDLGPINMAGYIDKGLHVSPTFGRDDHFNLPGGRPAGTEVYVAKMNKEGLLDALRERRTTATTSTKLLSGRMTVNDRHFMGDILDQHAVPDLNIKMHISGELHPEAKYKVSLYGDNKIGDGRLAKPVQVQELTGQDLIDTKGTVAFDQVNHTIGNKSAYYVEVQRVDPTTSNTDYLWTAPIWVEPISPSHSLIVRGIIGAGTGALAGF